LRHLRPPSLRLTLLLALALLAPEVGSCRFLPNHPYWIEALGGGQGTRVGAWPGGALVIGTDQRLWGYPGAWSQPWQPQGPAQSLRAIAASQTAVYGILADGQVARFVGGTWTPYAGSASWGASELAATEDDRVLVVVGGHVRLVDGVELKEAGCPSVAAVAITAPHADDVYVLDAAGALYHGAAGRCDPVDAPPRLQRIAAASGRLLGVGVDGSVWRRRDGAWTPLSNPLKFRHGRRAFVTRARDVAVSAYSSWIMDDEGAIFVLSDEA
jgi:hypothetical protein